MAMNRWQACRVMWLVVVVSGGLEAVTGIRCQSVLMVVGCGGVFILRSRFLLIRSAVARGAIRKAVALLLVAGVVDRRLRVHLIVGGGGWVAR